MQFHMLYVDFGFLDDFTYILCLVVSWSWIFQVGTLDQLVGLSDDLGKLDTYVESITRKIAAYLREILEGQRDKVAENLLANNSKNK